ncbi:MAG: HD domain-containing protein [Microgenomates group bacterium]
MNKRDLIQKTVIFVQNQLNGEGSGHDWWHIYRVWTLAKKIAHAEGANMEIVELASLLHDIADRKLNNGDEEAGLKRVEAFLIGNGTDKKTIEDVLHIIETYSYTAHLKQKKGMDTLEGKVVQDADRLDAIGAIGIARTFNYGGHHSRPLYDPNLPLSTTVTAKDYTQSSSPTINHFYEKLLHLKGLMNTQTAKKMATSRHLFMEQYLKQFYMEWEGKDLV